MPAGLQAWDETGALIVDLTTRLGRLVGIFSITATATGTVNVPAGFGELFVFCTGAGVDDESSAYTPFIAMGPDGLSFTYSPNVNYPGGARAATIIYGFR